MKNNKYPKWLVPKDIAEKLKEIGFDKTCYFKCDSDGVFFTDYVKATERGEFLAYIYIDLNEGFGNIPFWSDVLEWFREKGLHCYIEAIRTSIEYVDNNIGMPIVCEKPLKRPRMMQPITLYSYYTGTNAEGSSIFQLDNFNLKINAKKFKTYEECRYAMVIDLIEEYKKYHMNNEESN